VDSSGAIAVPATNLTTGLPGRHVNAVIDAVQLSDGTIALAWDSYSSYPYNIYVATFSPALVRTSGPTLLIHPAALTGGGYPSLTADAAGHVIVTWQDYDYRVRNNLYYALMSSNGLVVTPPSIFASGPSVSGGVTTSYQGYAVTSYSWQPSSGVDTLVGTAAASVPAMAGKPASLALSYANQGTTTATSVVMTATMASGLAYGSDTSGIVPTLSGRHIIWHLPDLHFMDSAGFVLRLNVPSAAVGTHYPVTLTIHSAGTDAAPANNVAHTEILVARSLYLPIIVANR
jgi:hypothetical protein